MKLHFAIHWIFLCSKYRHAPGICLGMHSIACSGSLWLCPCHELQAAAVWRLSFTSYEFMALDCNVTYTPPDGRVIGVVLVSRDRFTFTFTFSRMLRAVHNGKVVIRTVLQRHWTSWCVYEGPCEEALYFSATKETEMWDFKLSPRCNCFPSSGMLWDVSTQSVTDVSG